jgi:hypothetical protein
MGDRVERALEETVPLLRIIRKLKLLSEAEVRSVVQQRRDHEYALRRPGAPRSLFLRYAAFERDLIDLLTARLVERKVPDKRARNIVGQQSARVNLVYSRAIRKFKGDDQLYLHYVRHCISAGSRKAAEKVLAKAIAHRGDSERVWLAAIAFHFDSCGDVKVARALAQRALRALKTSKLIWREYFRLELVYLAKLIARRLTIGCDVPGEARALQSSPNAHTAEGNGPDTSENDKLTEEMTVNLSGRLEFWDGGVPLTILRSAIQAASLSADDACEYYIIATSIKLVPATLVVALERLISEAFCESLAPLVMFMKIRTPYDASSAKLRKQRAVLLASNSTDPLPSNESANGVLSPAASSGSSISLLEGEAQLVIEVCSAAESVVVQLERSCGNEWIGNERFSDSIRQFMASWTENLEASTIESLSTRCESILRLISQVEGPTVEGAEKLTLATVSVASCPQLWTQFLDGPGRQVIGLQDKSLANDIRASLKRAGAVPFRTDNQDAICTAWMRWEFDVDALRVACDFLFKLPPLSDKLLLAAIDAELRLMTIGETSPSGRLTSYERIREMYGKGTSIQSLILDADFWLRFVQFERDIVRDAKRAADVQWRAKRCLSKEQFTVFEERLILLNML